MQECAVIGQIPEVCKFCDGSEKFTALLIVRWWKNVTINWNFVRKCPGNVLEILLVGFVDTLILQAIFSPEFWLIELKIGLNSCKQTLNTDCQSLWHVSLRLLDWCNDSFTAVWNGTCNQVSCEYVELSWWGTVPLSQWGTISLSQWGTVSLSWWGTVSVSRWGMVSLSQWGTVSLTLLSFTRLTTNNRNIYLQISDVSATTVAFLNWELSARSRYNCCRNVTNFYINITDVSSINR